MSIATRIQAIEEHISDAYDSLSKFGITADNKNIENIAGLIDEIYNNSPKTDYISGTDLTIEDTRVGKIDFKDTDNIEKVGLGATSQDSEPTPDSPQDINIVKDNQNIIIKGKNLCEAKLPTTTQKGVTVTNNGDGTYTINGTNTSSGTITFRLNQGNGIDDNLQDYEDGAYTLDLGVAIPNVQTCLTQNTTYTNFIVTGYGVRLKSGTLSNVTNTFIYIAIRTGTTIDNVTIRPMLVKGTYTDSTIPSFKAYQENNYEINLSSKNLLNNTDLTFGIISQSDGKTISSSTSVLYTQSYIKVNSNQKYTISYNGTANASFRLFYYDNAKTYLSTAFVSGSQTPYVTFTTLSNAGYIKMQCANNFNNELQLEAGNTATDYIPYFNIELCKTENYQDYIFKNGKNWYLHKEINKKIVDSNTSITGYTTNVSGYYRYGINISDIKILTDGRAIPDLYCSHYKGQMVGNDGSWGAHQGIAIDNTHQRVYINDDTYYTQDATAYKTWIANNNLTIYYPLATSTETQITDPTLISQLNAWYNAQSMDDITYITVDGDLPMQLKLRALKK